MICREHEWVRMDERIERCVVCLTAKDLLDKNELKILFEYIQHQHVPYDKPELREVIKKLTRIANDNSRT